MLKHTSTIITGSTNRSTRSDPYLLLLLRSLRFFKTPEYISILLFFLAVFTSNPIPFPHHPPPPSSRMQDNRTERMPKLIATIRSIVEKEGFHALYVGFNVNLVRVLPSCITTFLSYEYISRYISQPKT